MADRPTIGVLLDFQEKGTFSKRPHYAIRTAYFDAIWKAGGLPVALPYLADAIADLIAHCDGVVTPGGSYPFPTEWYGEPEAADEILDPRFRFEVAFTESVLESGRPLFGICAGMQVMAGVAGGVFHRDVNTQVETDIDHLDERPAEEVAHSVSLLPGSLLARITGLDSMDVNTAHKEALKNQPEGLVISAHAPDGVVEAIELPDRPFALGVQWHPEFFAVEGDPNFRLFQALTDAAGEG